MLAGCGQQTQQISKPSGINIPSTSGSSAAQDSSTDTESNVEIDDGIYSSSLIVYYDDDTSGFKYPIEVYVDGRSLGELNDDTSDLYHLNLEKGEHEIKFVYTDDRSSVATQNITASQEEECFTFSIQAKGNFDIDTKIIDFSKTVFDDVTHTGTICVSLAESSIAGAVKDDNDVAVRIDDKHIGSVSAGKTANLKININEGPHKVTCVPDGNDANAVSHIIIVQQDGKTYNFACDNYKLTELGGFSCIYNGTT
jgi:hypothetical protein